MSLPALPPEIIAEIVGSVTDRETLAICARLCDDLYPLAQRRFFYHVTLDFAPCFRFRHRLHGEEREPSRRSPEKFLALLQRSAHLISYIRCLSVNIGEVPTSTPEDVEFATILSLLTELTSISYPVVDEELQILNRYYTSHTTIPYLRSLSPQQTRSITELNLQLLTNPGRGIDVRLGYLNHYPGLKRLTVGPLSRSQPDSVLSPVAKGPKIRYLEALTFDGIPKEDYDHTIYWLLDPYCTFSVARLKVLEVKVMAPNKNYGRLAELMGLCDNITELYLLVIPQAHSHHHISSGRCLTMYDGVYSPPSLQILPNLNNLTLQCEITPIRPPPGQRRNAFRNPLPWIKDILQTLPLSSSGSSHLSKITLIFKIPVQFHQDKLKLLDWGDLSDLFLSDMLSLLRRVVIRVVGSIPMPDGWAVSMLYTLRSDQHLSRLIKKDLLVLSP